MKKYYLISIALIMLILIGCSKNEYHPDENLESYLDYWESYNFKEMYQLLTEDTKEKISETEFIERYEVIYKDLEIDNLEVSYTDFSEEAIKEIKNEHSIETTIDVTMDSLAGPISFERQLTMDYVVLDEEEELADWFFTWDEGFVFPELVNGGSIKVETDRPRRGEILDRNRMPLAINDIAYEVGVVPGQIYDDNEINRIAQLLHMSVDSVKSKIEADWVESHHYVPVNVVSSQAETVLSELKNYPSIKLVETTGRVYPSENAAAHITGYVGRITAEELEKQPENIYNESDMIGKNGLELLLEERLRGVDGKRIIITQEDSDDKVTLAEMPVKHGEHIQLTIDINIQERIFEAYDDLSGSAAALHPTTGEVYALVSSPAFNPNDFVYGITETNWNALLNDENKPLVNRFTATYAPGSVIKPITGAIGLSNGLITHEEGIVIDGLTWKRDNWKDYQVKRVSTTSDPVDLKTALVKSDNIFFAMKAVEMGNDKFLAGLKDFGFEEALPINFPFHVSHISNSNTLTDEILRANTAYGQGEIEVSSLHMATMYTPFLNKGNMIKPTLLLDEKTGEVWKDNVISEADAEKIQSYLSAVIKEGTGKSAFDEDLEISGKTGTAELKLALGSSGHQNGWFVGYPTNEQDIVIAMMIEKTENIGTSSFVAKQVKDILLDIK